MDGFPQIVAMRIFLLRRPLTLLARPMKLGSLMVLMLAASAAAADFPAPYNSEQDTKAMPLTAAEAVARFKLPSGFRATLFAAEPDVQNPIALAWDARGRLWVAENYTFRRR